MPAVVAIPQVVEDLLTQFGDFFPNEPARRHFAEYMTGLFIAEHKTCDAAKQPFHSHTDLCIDLIDWVIEQDIPGDFTFDSYFSNAKIPNHIYAKKPAYVGDLKANEYIPIPDD